MRYTVQVHPTSRGAAVIDTTDGTIHTLHGTGTEAMSRALDHMDELNRAEEVPAPSYDQSARKGDPCAVCGWGLDLTAAAPHQVYCSNPKCETYDQDPDVLPANVTEEADPDGWAYVAYLVAHARAEGLIK